MTLDQAVLILSGAIQTRPANVDLFKFTQAMRVLADTLGSIGPDDPLQTLVPLYEAAQTYAGSFGMGGIGGLGINRTQALPTEGLTPPPPPGAAPVGGELTAQGGAGADLAGVGGPMPTIPPDTSGQTTSSAPLGPSPIGVPRGYAAPNRLDPRQSPEGARAAGNMLTHNPPRYFEGDEALPSTLDPGEVRRLQKELERAGLLQPNSYVPGFWDATSQQAYFAAMGYANQSGDHVRDVLKKLSLMPKPPTEAEQKEVRQFVPSDPAKLAQDVKSVFRQRLGREPRPDELRQMAAHLGAFEELAFESESAMLTERVSAAEQDAKVRGIAGNVDATPSEHILGSPGTPSPTDEAPFITLPNAAASVDPVARFLEAFDTRYGPEMTRNTNVEGTQQQYANVMQSLTTMQSLIS